MADRAPSPQGASPGSTRVSLLDRARGHDPAAWEQLVELYGPLVAYWCRRSGLGEDDVEDLFQQVFLAVAGGLPRFRHDQPGSTFRGWLLTIVRSRVADHFRGAEPPAAGGSSALDRLRDVAAPGDTPDPEGERTDCLLMRRAMEIIRPRIEPRTWDAFWLVAVEGREAADVAARLGLSVASVYQAKSRVLRQLREAFGELLD